MKDGSMTKPERRSRLVRILKEVDKVTETLSRIRQSLVSEIDDLHGAEYKPRSRPSSFPPDNVLREDYEKLLSDYANHGAPITQEFIQQHTVPHLHAFFRANNLPIDVKKHRKEEMARQLTGHLAQSLAIRGDVRRESATEQS